MPTPAEFSTIVAEAVIDLYDAQSLTAQRAETDFSTLNLEVPTGTAKVQVQCFPLPQTTLKDSGATYRPGLLILVRCHFKLADPEDERAYTEGAMPAILQTLTTPQTWRDLPGYHHLDEKPVGSDVLRVGNVVSFTVTVRVTINPV